MHEREERSSFLFAHPPLPIVSKHKRKVVQTQGSKSRLLAYKVLLEQIYYSMAHNNNIYYTYS